MTLEEFLNSLTEPAPPTALEPALQGLWRDAQGDWHGAHECAQAQDDERGAWVHAYLHRKEGDLSNARYWYGRAGRAAPDETLDEEWREIASRLLQASAGETNV